MELTYDEKLDAMKLVLSDRFLVLRSVRDNLDNEKALIDDLSKLYDHHAHLTRNDTVIARRYNSHISASLNDVARALLENKIEISATESLIAERAIALHNLGK